MGHRCAFKKMDIWKLPQNLIIGLKRFKQDYGRRRKDCTLVDFPLESLDMSKYVMGSESKSEPQIYDLYAVSNHMGSMSGGHYIAYIKKGESGWVNMDDNSVSKLSASKIVTDAAYVLFYRRRSAGSPRKNRLKSHPVSPL